MGAQRKHATAYERASAGSKRAWERFDRERAESLALVQRPVPKPLAPDAKAIAAVALYRAEKAKRAERGVTLDGSSGRHPVIHDPHSLTRPAVV